MANFVNIFRNQSPQWRLTEIERCLKQRPVGKPRFEDSHVTNYINVAKKLAGGKDAAAKLFVLSRDKKLAPYCEVFQLALNPYGNPLFGRPAANSYQRSVLDALALCAAPLEKIAELTGVSQEAVEIYEAIFFDVRDRAPFWITSMVLQPIFASSATGNIDITLKFAALALGQKGVEQLLFRGGLSEQDMETMHAKVSGWRAIKAAASTFMIPVNAYDHLEFEKQVLEDRVNEKKLVIARKEADGENTAKTPEEKAASDFVSKLLSAHNFTVASKYDVKPHLLAEEEPSLSSKLETELVKNVEAELVRTT
jgi:hypothetical protein